MLGTKVLVYRCLAANVFKERPCLKPHLGNVIHPRQKKGPSVLLSNFIRSRTGSRSECNKAYRIPEMTPPPPPPPVQKRRTTP